MSNHCPSLFTLYKVPKIYRPSRSLAAPALLALLLMNIASAAQAVDIDTYKADAFAQSAIDCSAPTLLKPTLLKSKQLKKHQSIALIDCKVSEIKRLQEAIVVNNSTSSTLSKDQKTLQQYLLYKAEAWLNYAAYEYKIDRATSVNSHSAAGNHALQSADTIMQAVKNSTEQTLDLNPDIPASSALMRPDLWAVLTALKENGGIEQAPRELAFSEVGLVWAAAGYCHQDANNTSSHFRAADHRLEQAREAYVNAHDSETNVALEALINSYYKQFALVDPDNDSCRGYSFTSAT